MIQVGPLLAPLRLLLPAVLPVSILPADFISAASICSNLRLHTIEARALSTIQSRLTALEVPILNQFNTEHRAQTTQMVASFL